MRRLDDRVIGPVEEIEKQRAAIWSACRDKIVALALELDAACDRSGLRPAEARQAVRICLELQSIPLDSVRDFLLGEGGE